MRIISGALKGKSLKFIKNSSTRPLKDSVKENIFNILKHSKFINVRTEKAYIFDLYSGVGSFGLECISRGADHVTFVEQDKKAADLLRENLIQLSIFDNATVINNKIEYFLKNNKKDKFDIFFFDPPFANNDYIHNLNLIKKYKIYKNEHVIIIHREKNTQDAFKDILNIIITKQYGRSKVIFATFNWEVFLYKFLFAQQLVDQKD